MAPTAITKVEATATPNMQRNVLVLRRNRLRKQNFMSRVTITSDYIILKNHISIAFDIVGWIEADGGMIGFG